MFYKVIALQKEVERLNKELETTKIGLDNMSLSLDAVETNLRFIGEHSQDIIAKLDKGGNIKWISQSIGKYGYVQKDMADITFFEFVHPKDLDKIYKDTVKANASTNKVVEWTERFRFRCKDGEWRWLEATITVKLHQGVEPSLLLVARDIIEHLKMERQIEHIAYHDELTGLANRLLLYDRLKMNIAHAKRHLDHVLVAFGDLDGFKKINDTYGHKVGDSYLKMLSRRFSKEFHEEDICGKILTLVKEPIILRGGKECSCGISLRVSKFPGHHDDPKELIKMADDAMYHAKNAGKNQYKVY